MPSHTVTPLRPRADGAYSDTDAVNDIQVILTRLRPGGEAVMAELADILARTGRPLVPVRDIEISSTETAHGWPVACTQAGDASVFVRQQPTGPGLLVEITTKTAAEAAALTVTLDGVTIHPHSHAGPQPA
jgi:hypothetical protein